MAVANRMRARRPRRRLRPEDILVFEGVPYADVAAAVDAGPSDIPERDLVQDIGGLLGWMLSGEEARSTDVTASIAARSALAGLAPIPPGLEALVAWAVADRGEAKTLESLVVRLSLLDDDLDPRVGLVVGNAYRLVRVVGRGQMGTVFEAERTAEKGPRVALKWIEDRSHASDRERMERLGRRFGRELRSLRRLSHANVSTVFDAGYDAALGAPWVVMELLVGCDLGALIAERGKLSAEVAVDLFAQGARGLAAAHAAGLIHRDIKPENLFLHRAASGDSIVKVCDFGLARLVIEDGGPGFTQSGVLLGSLAYMPPEQVGDARQADARSDVYSLGVALYQALSGRLPHDAGDLSKLYGAVLRHDIVPLAQLEPALEPRLVAVVERAMAKDPAARFQSMGELATALDALRSPPKGRRRIGPALAIGTISAMCAAAIGIGAFIAVSYEPPPRPGPSAHPSPDAPVARAPGPAAEGTSCIPEQDQGFAAAGVRLATVVARARAAGFRCSLTRHYVGYELLRMEHPRDAQCGVNVFYGDAASLRSMGLVIPAQARADATHAIVLSQASTCASPAPVEWLAPEKP